MKMNVTYKCNNGNAFISADGVNRMMASYEDANEALSKVCFFPSK